MWDQQALYTELERDEGFRPHAYTDTEGYLTIGIGRLCDARFPDSGLSREEAHYLLAHDVQRVAVAALDAIWPYWRDELDPVRQRVLLNMAFNLGEGRLARFVRMWAAINRKAWHTAAEEMLDSRWARQVGIRAERLAAAMRTGDGRYLTGEWAPADTGAA